MKQDKINNFKTEMEIGWTQKMKTIEKINFGVIEDNQNYFYSFDKTQSLE